MTAKPRRNCASCQHFRNDAASVEAGMPLLASLSSGHGSGRLADGLCLRHDRYLRATAACDLHALRREAP